MMRRMRARGDTPVDENAKAVINEEEGGDNKPRKTVMIRRKRVDENTEKVEMKYVSYNKVEKGIKTTTLDAICDASNYLKERASNVNYQESECSHDGSACTTTIIPKSSVETRKLRLCIPILAKIRSRFHDSANDEKLSIHKRKTSATMQALCDEILNEASYTLENGHPISLELMKKIQNINNLSRQILNNEGGLQSFSNDENEIARSGSRLSL